MILVSTSISPAPGSMWFIWRYTLRLSGRQISSKSLLRRRIMSALAPHGSTRLHEMATHSGGCEDMEGNRCLPHVLPAPNRGREHRKGFCADAAARRRLLERLCNAVGLRHRVCVVLGVCVGLQGIVRTMNG